MLRSSPSSQVKPQQWTACRSCEAAPPALLPPPVAAVARRTVAAAPIRAITAESAETSPLPQPPPSFADEETLLANYVPVYVMLPNCRPAVRGFHEELQGEHGGLPGLRPDRGHRGRARPCRRAEVPVLRGDPGLGVPRHRTVPVLRQVPGGGFQGGGGRGRAPRVGAAPRRRGGERHAGGHGVLRGGGRHLPHRAGAVLPDVVLKQADPARGPGSRRGQPGLPGLQDQARREGVGDPLVVPAPEPRRGARRRVLQPGRPRRVPADRARAGAARRRRPQLHLRGDAGLGAAPGGAELARAARPAGAERRVEGGDRGRLRERAEPVRPLRVQPDAPQRAAQRRRSLRRRRAAPEGRGGDVPPAVGGAPGGKQLPHLQDLRQENARRPGLLSGPGPVRAAHEASGAVGAGDTNGAAAGGHRAGAGVPVRRGDRHERRRRARRGHRLGARQDRVDIQVG